MTLLLVFGGMTVFVAIAVAAVIHAAKQNKQRIEDLRQEAKRLNFSFDDEGMIHTQLDHFHIFSQGRSRKSRNIMRGRATDLDITIFDYQYTTGSGKNARTHRLTIVSFDARTENIPSFSLRPEHVFHKLGQVFGYQDIDFDTHPEFSKKYLLRGSAENEIRGVFTPHVLDYFTANPGACVEATGGQLIYYPARQRVEPDQLDQLLQDAVKVYALIAT